MASTDKNCYLGIKGKKVGPVSEQDIQRLYAEKKIPSDIKFFRVGMKEWVPLSESGLIIIEDNIPPLPPEESIPPLPKEDKQPSLSQDNKPVKKSKLGIIAASLGVAVVAVIIVAVILINNMNNANPVNNSMAQNTSTPSPTTAPTIKIIEPSVGTAPTDNTSTNISTQTPTTTPDIQVSKPLTTDTPHATVSEPLTGIDNAPVNASNGNSTLPSLDKAVWSDSINHVMMIPSTWDYEPTGHGSGFIIDCKEGDNIYLTTFSFTNSNNSVEEFMFADGVVGYYQEIFGYGEFANFVYPLSNDEAVYFNISYNHNEDLDWYNENKELLFAIARTIAFNNSYDDSQYTENPQGNGNALVGNPVGVPNYIYNINDYYTYLEAVNKLTTSSVPIDMGDGTYRVTIPVGFFQERYVGEPWARQHQVLVSYTLVAGESDDGFFAFTHRNQVVFENIPPFIADTSKTTFTYREKCRYCDWVSGEVNETNFNTDTRGGMIAAVHDSRHCPNCGENIIFIIGRIYNYAVVGTGEVFSYR